jgi:hypothetical protein
VLAAPLWALLHLCDGSGGTRISSPSTDSLLALPAETVRIVRSLLLATRERPSCSIDPFLNLAEVFQISPQRIDDDSRAARLGLLWQLVYCGPRGDGARGRGWPGKVLVRAASVGVEAGTRVGSMARDLGCAQEVS